MTTLQQLLIVVFLFQLCLVVHSFNKYREHRKKHSATMAKKHHSRAAYDSDEDTEIALPNECYHRYAETDHHFAFLHWLHHKNVSHYTPMSPSSSSHANDDDDDESILRKIQPQEVKDGLQLTMGTTTTQHGCDSRTNNRRRRMKPIHANMPIINRALCQYEYILNYKPNRIPATLSEVKCICTRPFSIGGIRFECELLYYNVRILLFEKNCQSYEEQTEKIAFACVPVYKAHIDYDDALIDVPAEEPI